jgi:hypothetical protein
MNLRICWGIVNPEDYSVRDEIRDFATADELVDCVASLRTADFGEFPPLGIIRRANGDTLSVGLGAPILYPDNEDEPTGPDFTVMTYVPADGGPPTYTSHGAVAFEGEFAYYYFGNDSEYGGEAAVELPQALEVIRQFAEGDGLPDAIAWEQD